MALGGSRKTDGTSKADPFRKPEAGMWGLMQDRFNAGVLVDLASYFYVGDAVGRKVGRRLPDHRAALLLSRILVKRCPSLICGFFFLPSFDYPRAITACAILASQPTSE